MNRSVLILTIFCLLVFQEAKTQSTTEYFPLALGNYWEYWFHDGYHGWVGFSHTVRKDTLMPNGKTYRQIFEKDLIWHYENYFYYRTEGNQIFKYYSDSSECPEREYIYHNFGIKDSVYWPVCIQFNGNQIFRTTFTFNEYNDVFNKVIENKETVFAALINGDTINLPLGAPCPNTIGKGIGMVSEWRCDLGFYVLKGAIIDGIKYGVITSSAEGIPVIPDFIVLQNYPNPFNPSTKIEYHIPKTSYVKLIVYDIIGRAAAVLYDGFLNAGEYTAEFNGSNLPSGIYLYKLQADQFIQIKKMTLLK